MNYLTEQVCNIWGTMDKDHVAANEDKLNAVASLYAKSDPDKPNWRIRRILPENDTTFISHIFYGSAVNFCFTILEPPYAEYEVEGFRRSMAMSRCFYRRFGERPILPEAILSITDSIEEMMRFFGGKNLPPFLEKRRENLREAAKVLKRDFDGDPARILRKCDWNGCNLFPDVCPDVIGMLEMKFPLAFGQDRLFRKRSQLFTLLYQGRALNSAVLKPLKNMENLGPIADSAVPNALRYLGILQYSSELAAKIDRREIIAKDSAEEFEIRVATVYIVSKLLRLINKMCGSRRSWTIAELDHKLWLLGREAPTFYHLTPTTDY